MHKVVLTGLLLCMSGAVIAADADDCDHQAKEEKQLTDSAKRQVDETFAEMDDLILSTQEGPLKGKQYKQQAAVITKRINQAASLGHFTKN